MWSCTDITNFIRIERSATELWRYVDFQDGGHMEAIASQIYFRFLVLSRFAFRKELFAYQISTRYLQSTAEILLLPVSENRPQYWNSCSGFDFDLFTVIGMRFCTGLPNFMQIGWWPTELWHHIDLTRWWPQRRKSTSGFRFGHDCNLGRFEKLSAYQISIRYLNRRARYYYFRFLKTNGRHIEILLPVSILTFALSSACVFPSAYQISAESDNLRQSWIGFRVIVAHPRSENGGLCFVLKFRLDWIYNFGDRAIFIFWHLSLKLPIHVHF